MKYAIRVQAMYNMWVEANSEAEAVAKAEEAFAFLEEDYPCDVLEDTGDLSDIELLYFYGEKE